MMSRRNAGTALILIMVAVLLGYLFVHLKNNRDQAEAELIENVFFQGCVKDSSDIEHRRTCGRAAHAYANGKLDYQAYGKTITWDKEARTYIIKDDVK